MAGRVSTSEIARKYENKFRIEHYTRAAESLKSPYEALDRLKKGEQQARINGMATSDAYEKLENSAERIKGKISRDGNRRIISQYEDFISSCKSHAGHFYDKDKSLKKSSSPRP